MSKTKLMGKTPTKKAIIAMYGDLLADPPSRQAAEYLANSGYEVRVISCSVRRTKAPEDLKNLTIFDSGQEHEHSRPIERVLRFLRFGRLLRRQLTQFKPDLVVSIMLHPLACLPAPSRCNFKLVSCIYDIPVPEFSGRFDRILFRRGWARLSGAAVVWASDPFKAELSKSHGNLHALPEICYNCPPKSYMKGSKIERDGWLRSRLIELGASLSDRGGSILLRAGAVGEACGLEETLQGMVSLPDDFVFVMMGRPPSSYKSHLLRLIEEYGLRNRAFLWDRVSDDIWKRSLAGADIGHLIHGPFRTRYHKELARLNSSLSNNRLFQYMAAGLPIISYDDPRMQVIYDAVDCFAIARISNLESDMKAHWISLGTDPSLRNRLGTNGRRAHLDRYNWDAQFGPILGGMASRIVGSGPGQTHACSTS